MIAINNKTKKVTEAKASICFLLTTALDAAEDPVNAFSSKNAGNTKN